MVKRRTGRATMTLLEEWARGARTKTPFSQSAVERLFPAEQLRSLNQDGELTRLVQIAREREASARNVRRWLEEAEAIATGQARPCTYCGRAMTGRRDRAYCSVNCRVNAHNRRHRAQSHEDKPRRTEP